MSDAAKDYDKESNILIVDDDNTLLKFFKIHLNKFFSKVFVVKNAKEAVEAIKTKEIDLVITDIRMPRVTGLQLMTKVRKHDPSIPVLVVSGALLSEEQEETLKDADGFLRKPFTVDELHGFIMGGIQKRVSLKELSEIIPDKKNLKSVLTGKSKLKKFTTEDNHQHAEEILSTLNEAS